MSKNTNNTTGPSALPSTQDLTLAGKKYTITQLLTLAQARDIGVGVASTPNPDPQLEFRRLFDGAVNIISTAISIDYPDMTPEKILTIHGITTKEMWAAMDDVLVFAGLQKRAPTSGEETAAAT